jgi:hypothetical protein
MIGPSETAGAVIRITRGTCYRAPLKERAEFIGRVVFNAVLTGQPLESLLYYMRRTPLRLRLREA